MGLQMKEKEVETVYIKLFLKNILNPWGHRTP